LTDIRYQKMAQILVDHSARVTPGDRVAITAGTYAEPLVRAVYELVLDRGGLPHVLFEFSGEQESLFAHASDAQLDYLNIFHKTAFESFDAIIKIRAEDNTRSLTNVPSGRIARRQAVTARLIQDQMRRGATGELRWMSTICPTPAYAMEAEMGVQEYENFFFRACHADENTPDPVAYWRGVKTEQQRIMRAVQGRDRVTLRGPNVDLSLSIKGRTFVNSCGEHNLPDGEIFTGPVEDSASGWVRYTYPAMYSGRVVEGIQLTFEQGRVVKATATQNEDLLLKMLDSDPGARYIGEFAIGTNFEIDRFTRSILLDEKIGGSFHMAVGAGYPETGSVNKSVLHWDMICDLRQDSEIRMDGDLIYKDGQFTV
jgi:aminopeptidase